VFVLLVLYWHVRVGLSVLEFVSITNATYLKIALSIKECFCDIVFLDHDHLLLVALKIS
jgi:hypothetical protein